MEEPNEGEESKGIVQFYFLKRNLFVRDRNIIFRKAYIGDLLPLLVKSPKVATYDLQPEMSAPEVGERLTAAITSDKYDVIVINFANPDMVGHTGVISAAIQAVERIDQCVGAAVEAVSLLPIVSS